MRKGTDFSGEKWLPLSSNPNPQCQSIPMCSYVLISLNHRTQVTAPAVSGVRYSVLIMMQSFVSRGFQMPAMPQGFHTIHKMLPLCLHGVINTFTGTSLALSLFWIPKYPKHKLASKIIPFFLLLLKFFSNFIWSKELNNISRTSQSSNSFNLSISCPLNS